MTVEDRGAPTPARRRRPSPARLRGLSFAVLAVFAAMLPLFARATSRIRPAVLARPRAAPRIVPSAFATAAGSVRRTARTPLRLWSSVADVPLSPPAAPSAGAAEGTVRSFVPCAPSASGAVGVAAIVVEAGSAVSGTKAEPEILGAGVEDGAVPRAKKQDKSGDLTGCLVKFENGAEGVVVCQRPPVAFVLCRGAPQLGSAAGVSEEKVTRAERPHAADATPGKIRASDYLGNPLVINEEDGSVVATSETDAGEQAGEIFGRIPKVSEIGLINEPMLTGMSMVDTMCPVGRGQNVLLIGEKKDGAMRSLAVDTLTAQTHPGGVDTCVYALTAVSDADRKDIIDRLRRAGILDSVTLVTTTSVGDGSGGKEATASHAAEAVAVCASAVAVAERAARNDGGHGLTIVDSLDQHRDVWDHTTNVLLDIYGRDAVVKQDSDGGAGSEKRAFFSSLVQRAGRYKDSAGGGSVTLMLMSSFEAEEMEDNEGASGEETVYGLDAFEGYAEKIKTRLVIMEKAGIKITPSVLKKIGIPAPIVSDGERLRRLSLLNIDDLISMSDGQIWLDTSAAKSGGGQSPPVNVPRSLARVGIGADTASQADASAIRELVGGLRFDFQQAAASLAEDAPSTVMDISTEKMLRRHRAWLLAMHQEPGNVRSLSNQCVALCAANIGRLDSSVEAGNIAGTEGGRKIVEDLIGHVRGSIPDVMDSIDKTNGLTVSEKEKLVGAVSSFFDR